VAAGRPQTLPLRALAALLLYASACSHDGVDFRQFLSDPNKFVIFIFYYAYGIYTKPVIRKITVGAKYRASRRIALSYSYLYY